MAFKSQQTFYDEFILELQSEAPDLTDTNEGSKIDVLAGVTSHAVQEIQSRVIEEIKKLYFSTAEGEDLEKLAVDRYGSEFARPAPGFADGVVTFSRPTTNWGDALIPAGTVVKTEPNADGETTNVITEVDVIITGLSINASVTATVAGTSGNVEAGELTVLETAIDDPSVVVTNALALTGGTAEMEDAEYREHIAKLLLSLNGATLEAIEAKVATVAGVESVAGVETRTLVKEWNAATDATVGDPFYVARTKVYVADSNGTASQNLLDAVKAAIEELESTGVEIEVFAAVAITLDWSAEYTLNPSGPHYTTLLASAALIEFDMEQYINNLAIGADFDRATAEAYILAKWGPAGSDDLTAFDTVTPTGDIAVDPNEKVIAGAIEVV